MVEQCSACHTVPYCSRRCQVAAWSAANPPGGHKEECKVLQILSWFTEKDWTRYNGQFRFT
ncbi:hypothetical protein NEOLEDRAFT_1127308 [Neolentinus lepideus HHB14362 ss-1]|uniref:MYND-type domain-containing protein n=1 Tax=Neolentinus lepideus HHB14362 ss-1 TaxID=1314782 RepID=A0A165VFH5_9AGAM|nr:hypothetical protein NEOLEDRAFT_1127308 [Neolentinus lepideus HHB14362 ss-1]